MNPSFASPCHSPTRRNVSATSRCRASRSAGIASGFTLIELLTVIAIIGILAAIMIPTLGKTRRMANDAQCKSSMRQWGVALQLYVDDHKGQLPGPCPGWVRRYISPVNDATNHIFQFLAPYAGIKNISGGFVPENMICSGWVKEAPHTAVKDGSGEVYCLKSPNMQNVDIPYGYTDDSGTRKEPRFYTDVLESSRTTKSFALIDLDTEYNVEVLGGSAKTTLIPPKAVHGNHWNVLHWDWHVSNKTKAQLLDTSN